MTDEPKTELTLAFDMRAPDSGRPPPTSTTPPSNSPHGPTGSGFTSAVVMEHHATTDGYLPSPTGARGRHRRR